MAPLCAPAPALWCDATPQPMRNLERELTKGSPTAFRVVEAIGFARIPILRLVHTPTKTDIDLSFNSVVGETQPAACQSLLLA